MEKEKTIDVSLKEYVDVKVANAKEVSDLKILHLRELREADQKALALVAKNNDLHFFQLNENAKRTIEERGHFVSKEAYDPFERSVLKYIDENQGRGAGRVKDWAIIVSVFSFVISLIYLGITLYKL